MKKGWGKALLFEDLQKALHQALQEIGATASEHDRNGWRLLGV
jgi:hypothetical protein